MCRSRCRFAVFGSSRRESYPEPKMRRESSPCFAIAVALLGCSAVNAGDDFSRDIRPILAANCFACHGSEAQKAKLDLERYRGDPSQVLRDIKIWQGVGEKVSTGAMPPLNKRPLGD